MLTRVSEGNVASRASERRAGSATRRFASLSTLAVTSFLCAYMVLHALHVMHRDPQFLKLLSAIPLFACSGTAMLAGVLFGVLCNFASLDHDKLLQRIPTVLALSVVLFTLEILIGP